MPELFTEIEGVFLYALNHREMVDIIQSDSTEPNSRSLKKKKYPLFRFEWIEILQEPGLHFGNSKRLRSQIENVDLLSGATE